MEKSSFPLANDSRPAREDGSGQRPAFLPWAPARKTRAVTPIFTGSASNKPAEGEQLSWSPQAEALRHRMIVVINACVEHGALFGRGHVLEFAFVVVAENSTFF